LSEGILPYARLLAHDIGLPAELLFVQEAGRSSDQEPAFSGPEYLAGVAASFAAAPDVKATVEYGDPAETIIARAAAQPDALIAMATHGYSAAKRWLLGSVAEKVLQGAANHLLLVRPEKGEPVGKARLKTVVVALDGSGLAEAVLPIVSELALRLRLEVLLVRVLPQVYFAVPDSMVPTVGMNLPSQQEVWAQARSAARVYLEGKAEHLRAAGVADVSALVVDGSAGGAAAEIIDLARRTSENMVAMSTHGASGLGRWLIGSVTERVVRYSSDPVLVIRPRS
jgi:nucleotide-binding universal stress UspA family protein